MLRERDLEARVLRLRELVVGLAREVKRWSLEDDPLLPPERRTYLRGIQDGIAGAETARVMLEKVLDRLAEQRRRIDAFQGGAANGKGERG